MKSPNYTNRLARHFGSDLIYMVIKNTIFIKCSAMEFDCWNFARIESQIVISTESFWLEIIICNVLQTLRESLLAFSQL